MKYAASLANSVTPYHPADAAVLHEFQLEYFGPASPQCSDAFRHWSWGCNPHRHDDAPLLWVCKRDGVVVGQQARMPVSLKIGDLQYQAAWGIDLMVRKEWRLRGVGPALFAAFARATDPALGLGIDDAAYQLCRREGWTDIATLPLFVRPLDPTACAAALSAPRLLTKLLPKFVLKGSAALSGRTLGTFSRVHLEPIEIFDERVDSVWRRAKGNHVVLVRRDFPSLRWRFDQVPWHRVYRRFYLKRGSAVIGYVVVRVEKWHGHLSAHVSDYLTEEHSLGALLALTIRECSRFGAAVVFFEQLHTRAETLLRALGCLRVRRSKRFMFNVSDRASPLSQILTQPENWFVTPADSDFDHLAAAAQNHA